jgi:hypothetical protein
MLTQINPNVILIELSLICRFDHFIAGGKTSANYILFFVNFASTIIPSMFFKFGIFFKA